MVCQLLRCFSVVQQVFGFHIICDRVRDRVVLDLIQHKLRFLAHGVLIQCSCVIEHADTDSVLECACYIFFEIRILFQVRLFAVHISHTDHGEGYTVCFHGCPVDRTSLVLIFGNGNALCDRPRDLGSVTPVEVLVFYP